MESPIDLYVIAIFNQKNRQKIHISGDCFNNFICTHYQNNEDTFSFLKLAKLMVNTNQKARAFNWSSGFLV